MKTITILQAQSIELAAMITILHNSLGHMDIEDNVPAQHGIVSWNIGYNSPFKVTWQAMGKSGNKEGYVAEYDGCSFTATGNLLRIAELLDTIAETAEYMPVYEANIIEFHSGYEREKFTPEYIAKK